MGSRLIDHPDSWFLFYLAEKSYRPKELRLILENRLRLISGYTPGVTKDPAYGDRKWQGIFLLFQQDKAFTKENKHSQMKLNNQWVLDQIRSTFLDKNIKVEEEDLQSKYVIKGILSNMRKNIQYIQDYNEITSFSKFIHQMLFEVGHAQFENENLSKKEDAIPFKEAIRRCGWERYYLASFKNTCGDYYCEIVCQEGNEYFYQSFKDPQNLNPNLTR